MNTFIIAGKNKQMEMKTSSPTEIERARIISRTLGHYVAARYLAKRNWSLEAALWIVARSTRNS